MKAGMPKLSRNSSVSSGMLLLIHLFGGPAIGAAQSFGAIHVQSPLASPILAALPFLFLASITLVAAVAWSRFRAEFRLNRVVSYDTLLRYLVAALLVFVVTNKVFSPQYVTWFLPFFPLLSLRHAALGAIVIALTIAIFPFHFLGLMHFEPFSVVLLNTRNALTLALLVWLVMDRGSPITDSRPLVSGMVRSIV